MKLYLVRHGNAVNIGEQGVFHDEDRVLSADGLKKTKEVALGFKLLGEPPARIISSPLKRAVETAEIFAQIAAPRVKVEPLEVLRPGRLSTDVLSWLSKQKVDCVMLVGHMPDLAHLASYLLSGSHELNITFKKAAVCRIDFEKTIAAGKGELVWHLPPSILRSLTLG